MEQKMSISKINIDQLNYLEDDLLVKIFRSLAINKVREKYLSRIIIKILNNRKKLYLLTLRN